MEKLDEDGAQDGKCEITEVVLNYANNCKKFSFAVIRTSETVENHRTESSKVEPRKK